MTLDDRIAEIRRMFHPWAKGHTPRERLMLEAIWHLLNQFDDREAKIEELNSIVYRLTQENKVWRQRAAEQEASAAEEGFRADDAERKLQQLRQEKEK